MKNKVEKYLTNKNISSTHQLFDEKGRYLISDDIEGVLAFVRLKKTSANPSLAGQGGRGRPPKDKVKIANNAANAKGLSAFNGTKIGTPEGIDGGGKVS